MTSKRRQLILDGRQICIRLDQLTNSALAAADITGVQALTLLHILGNAEAGVSVTSLHQVSGHSKATISRLVRRLWEKGYVRLEPSTEDGRRHVTMKPDDQVCYTTDHRLLVESGVDASASLAWMSGGLKLHGLTLREIANILERKYSVEIHVSPDLAGELFNCHFDSTITLQEALKLLSESGRFKYREKGNEIYFYNQ